MPSYLINHFRADCPHCGKPLNSTAAAEPGVPQPGPGDLSVCWGCVNVIVFTVDGFRKPTAEEALEGMDMCHFIRCMKSEGMGPLG